MIPYFGYARQDCRASGQEAVGDQLVANLLESGACLGAWSSSPLYGDHRRILQHPLEALVCRTDAHSRRPRGRVSTNKYCDRGTLMGAAELAERYTEPLGLP